jgi:carboxypeptidase Q
MKNLLVIVLLAIALAAKVQEKDYTDFVNDLSSKIKQAPFRHSAYDRLAYITDTYGPRMWGSMALEQVIYEMANMASKVGFDNVRLEQVKNFTKWVRGDESLTLYEPRPNPQPLSVTALGGSVSG